MCFKADASEAEEVAAVGDGDVVRLGLVTQGLKDGPRINPAIRARRVARPGLGAAVAMALLQSVRPRPVYRRAPIAGFGHDGVQRKGWGREDFRLANGDCR